MIRPHENESPAAAVSYVLRRAGVSPSNGQVMRLIAEKTGHKVPSPEANEDNSKDTLHERT